jgi:sugar O-acyltransferase (sialic acid O-acetyltransferase NeuD family)
MRLNNFKKKLLCWGTLDQCAAIKTIVEGLGAQYDILVDDDLNKKPPFEAIEFLSGRQNFESWLKGRNMSEWGFIVAIGSPYGFIRCQLHDYLVGKGLTSVSICDPSALLDYNITLGEGVQIMKGVIVNTQAKIGKQCILNTRSTIEHHDEIEQGVGIGPGAILCGRVTIKEFSWIGAGATVISHISIGANTIVGAGAMVRQNVPDNIVVGGVPAKFIKVNSCKT